MSHTLLAWIGRTDLDASEGKPGVGVGPIAQAAHARKYESIALLCNYPKPAGNSFRSWLQARGARNVSVRQVSLSSPMSFGEIYEQAVCAVKDVVNKDGASAELTYHLSPGTSAMAAVWIILAKTRFPAELIESSREKGVETASVPFDISAEFIPDLLRKPDENLRQLSAGLPLEAPEFGDIIHKSPAMTRVIALARRAAPRSVPVLIEGESGTGKELLARAIHGASPRAERERVIVNCGAIPENLIESELFGHEKGAFTGADKRHTGFFEEAGGGTIFLDEIGDLPQRAQVKLLRVLQEGEVLRVGAVRPIKVDVRIIAATNKVLAVEVAEGRFREDLFYRLAVAVIRIPPLRERVGDLSLLIVRLLEKANRDSVGDPGFEPKKLSAGAKNLLLNHSWPGNVRELQNTLQRLVIWSPEPTITADDVHQALLPISPSSSLELLGRPLGDGLKVQDLMTQLVRHYLERALDEANGNKSKAAQLIGLASYQTFANWMDRYDVTR